MFNRVLGFITGCEFDTAGNQLFSATTEGNVIVWLPLDETGKRGAVIA